MTIYHLHYISDEPPAMVRWIGLMECKCFDCNKDKFDLQKFWGTGNGEIQMSMNGETQMFKCKCQECGEEFECEEEGAKLCDDCMNAAYDDEVEE